MTHGAPSQSRYRITSAIGRSWPAAVGLALAILGSWRPELVAVGVPGHRLELHLPAWALVCVAGAMVAVFLAVISSLIPAPRRNDPDGFVLEPPPPPRLSPIAIIVLLGLAGITIVLAFTFLHMLDGRDPTGHAASPSATVPPPATVQPPTVRDGVHARAVDLGLTITVSTISVVVIACAWLVIAGNQPWATIAEWLRRRPARKRAFAAELASAMAVGQEDLEGGDDPRQAVIACYRRCEDALALRRRRRYQSETPREFVHDALVALRLPTHAVRSLLTVFERARFSDLPITGHDRGVAIAALSSVRSTLEQRMRDESER
jgi:hypothetical protein